MSGKKTLSFALLCYLGCYLVWGMQPLYWSLLGKFDSMFVMCVRVIMAAVFVVGYLACAGRFHELIATFKDKNTMKYLAPAALFLCGDWALFIWAVTNGHVLDATLGYYFNPLMIFLAGLFLVKEKGSALEYIAVGLACMGVVISVIKTGAFPVLSLSFALMWPVYATIKRFAKADPIVSFGVEVTLLTPFAIAGMLIFYRGAGGFGEIAGGGDLLLLMGAGIVTALPMILYNMVVNELPFKMVGILQYAGSTINFICGAVFMHEAITQPKLIMFVFIWAGLIIYTIGSFKKQKTITEQQ